MLCISPGSSELRTRLIKAARGLDEVGPNEDFALARRELVCMACLLFEFCSSQRAGSGAFFFLFGGMGRSIWYGLDGGGWAVMCTTLFCHRDGTGTVQIPIMSMKQRITAICLLEMELRIFAGMYRPGDQRDEGFGDIQKVEEDDREDADDEVEEEDLDGKENNEIWVAYGFLSNLGDFSVKGSFCGELKSRQTVDSRKPMTEISDFGYKERRKLAECLWKGASLPTDSRR